jgi:hypothetical protein
MAARAGIAGSAWKEELRPEKRVRNQHLADISSGRLIEILKDDEGRKQFAFSAAGCLFLVTTTFASAQRAVSYAYLPDSLVVMTAADSQRQTQLQQEIPQKNGDTKPSNAGTPGGAAGSGIQAAAEADSRTDAELPGGERGGDSTASDSERSLQDRDRQ